MRRRLALEALETREVPAVYYVAPTGSNGNTGSTDAPWLTLQHAANSVGAGDQVVVRAGTYAGFNMTTDGSAAAPIQFTADPGVTINAPNPSGPHAGRDGINLEGADYVVIQGFTVVGMPRAGIRVVTNTGAVVRNNTADLNGRWGIFTGWAENVIIENNVTTRSQAEHGIYVSNSADNPVVRGNTSWGNAACGIQLNSDVFAGGDGVITGALIENNVVYDNGRIGGAGLNMDGVSDSIVRNNLMYGNHASGIALYQINGAHGAWNNVIANNTILQAADARWALLIMGGSTGNKVFNNVLWHAGTFRGSMSVFPDSLPGFASDYNVVMDRFTLDDGGSRLSLAQWQAQTGLDAHSLVAAPADLFVDPAGNNYRLKAGSAAVDRGTGALAGAAAPTRDLAGTGRPSGAAFDIGAYELDQGAPQGPIANPDSYSVTHDRLLTVPRPGVLGNDSTPTGQELSATLVSQPAHGTLTLYANGSFTYRPAAGFVGTDTFTYVASDGTLASEPATVTISVTDAAPVAVDDAYKVGRDRNLSVKAPGVLANDSDADGDARTAALVVGPANGTLRLNANGSFTYKPNPGFVGTDTFQYRAVTRLQASAPATVTITVLAPPQVTSVMFNDGSAQRSAIRSITVTFDTLVKFDPGAFTLVRAGGSIPTKTRSVTSENGHTKVEFTFTGMGTQFRSLADGNWALRVLGARVHRADHRPVVMAADHLTRFHRFFGDADGDRDVDETDRAAFELALGQTDAASLSSFDFDNDGDVDAADHIRFDRRFGRGI